MGCRTRALWIIPTLQLFVWRANAKLCILQQKKKKKGKREKRSCCWGRGIPLSDGSGQFHQLVGIPDWQSPCLGSKQEMRWRYLLQWNNKCRLQRHFIFLECLLLRQLPIWRWMYHTLFLRSWEIWGRKRTSERAKRTKRKMHWKDLICFWVSERQAGILGGGHGGSQRILCYLNCWVGGGSPWNQCRGSQRSPMGILRPLMDKPSLVAQLVKNQSVMQETWVLSLGWEDPLEKRTATHSSILAWRIPWIGEPGRL